MSQEDQHAFQLVRLGPCEEAAPAPSEHVWPPFAPLGTPFFTPREVEARDAGRLEARRLDFVAQDRTTPAVRPFDEMPACARYAAAVIIIHNRSLRSDVLLPHRPPRGSTTWMP